MFLAIEPFMALRRPSSDDADTQLKERVPDLILLDWMLPGLAGIGFAGA